MVQRLHAHPYLSLFNGADPSLSTPNRDGSTVPLQALFLLNNPFIHEQSERLAKRLILESKDIQARINYATLLAYGRPATSHELERWLKFIDAYQAALTAESSAAAGSVDDSRELITWSAIARSLLASNEFFFVD